MRIAGKEGGRYAESKILTALYAAIATTYSWFPVAMPSRHSTATTDGRHRRLPNIKSAPVIFRRTADPLKMRVMSRPYFWVILFGLFSGGSAMAQDMLGYFEMANSAFNNNDRIEAVRLLTKAIEVENDSPRNKAQAVVHQIRWKALGLRAAINVDDERPHEAITDINAAIVALEEVIKNPRERRIVYANMLRVRADALRLLKNFDAASADIEAALRIQPDWPGYLLAKALIHYDMGQSDEALRIIGQGIEKRPDYRSFFEERARIYTDNGREDLAKSDWDRACALLGRQRKGVSNKTIEKCGG